MKEEFQIFWSESLPQSLLRTLLFKKVNLVENSSQLSRYLNQDKSFSTNQKKINQLFSPFALYTIFIRIYLSLSDFHSISAMQLHRWHIIIGFLSDRLPRSGHHSSVYFKVLFRTWMYWNIFTQAFDFIHWLSR